MIRALCVGLIATLLALVGTQARAEVAVPALAARVTDTTGTLSASDAAALEAKLAAFETRKGSQIAVLMVPSTEPETIEQYGIRVAEAWKLGRKGVDDGAILIVAKDDRKLRIEVGYGLEGALPDAIAKRIIREDITPLFRNDDYLGGINAGVDRLISVADGEALPPPKKSRSGASGSSKHPPLELLFIAFFAIWAVMGVVKRAVGTGLASVGVGGIVGVIAAVVLTSLVAGLIIAVVAAIFAAIAYSSSGGRRGGFGGFGGGGLGGGGGFGGGGGGFGGGGGGFGGGGASGGW